MATASVFTQEELEKCRTAFLRFDKDRNGTIDSHELRSALEAFGQRPSEEEILVMCVAAHFHLRLACGFVAYAASHPNTHPCRCRARRIAEVDANANGVIDYAEFVRVLENQKARTTALGNEGDMIDAFVACGGNDDKSGFVERERVVKIVKEDFCLAMDIDALFVRYDTAGAGQMAFSECVGRAWSCFAPPMRTRRSLTHARLPLVSRASSGSRPSSLARPPLLPERPGAPFTLPLFPSVTF